MYAIINVDKGEIVGFADTKKQGLADIKEREWIDACEVHLGFQDTLYKYVLEKEEDI